MFDRDGETSSLASLQAGCAVEVVNFLGCRRRAQRLAELGMTPGTRLEIMRAAPGQPLLLRVRGAMLAVDRRSARDVIVRPCGRAGAVAHDRAGRRRRWRPRFGRGRRHRPESDS
ncbi:MAG: FeoA family protein [Anaerolineales bacterium]|jgi:Fe2+ transport system protein FeoA